MKKTLMMILATILLAALITAFLVSFNVHTSAEGQGDYGTAYESVQIQPTDTLWSISQKYCTSYGMTTKQYVQELKKVNRLTSDHIIAGNYLVVVKYAAR